jgi:hypothetical protein
MYMTLWHISIAPCPKKKKSGELIGSTLQKESS